MISFLLVIGLLLTPGVHAQEDEDTIYFKIKKLVEAEVNTTETELAIERFAAGAYYDHEIPRGVAGTVNPFDVEVEYVDLSIIGAKGMREMCGDKEEEKVHRDFCFLAQLMFTALVERNSWHFTLGRDLQTIASGYEVGIDGYPGKPVDAITRMTSIAHLWRASNDTYIQPFVEELTKAIQWPKAQKDEIEQKLKDVVKALKDLIRTVDDREKEDMSEMAAIIRRYRHGVKYVRNREGDCESAPEFPDDPDRVWLERRNCSIEDKLLFVLDDLILPNVTIEKGNNAFILFPSFKDEKENIFIWIREDDIGLQWYIPLEPVQAALYHPDYGDCLEGDSVRNCYDTFSEFFILHGGLYPIKQDETGLRPGEAGLFPGQLNPPREDLPDDEEHDQEEGAIMPQPHESEGICSHPFSQRGYLCRPLESEACDIDKNEREELEEAREEAEEEEDEDEDGDEDGDGDEREGVVGGIILTRCQPERFRGDVTRHVSGNDICGIGGWRERVPEHEVVEDTPDEDPEMRPSYCAACVVDITCKDKCGNFDATTSFAKHDGVIDICMNNKESANKEYLMIHEMAHAQETCNLSNLQAMEWAGFLEDPRDPEACCASERTAYFVQCKVMALDGILEKAKVSIDQCASVFANFSCAQLDDDPDDEDYICSTGSTDPKGLFDKINEARDEMIEDGTLTPITTCAGAIKSIRVQAIKNSFPLACRPGCEARYTNTIGNNLCYTGQCIEESHEWSRPIAGRSPLTTVDEDFPWDSCEEQDLNIGAFEVPPAITAPKFPVYRPEYLLQQLDIALCQINGLPARTPPIICEFDVTNRIGLAPLNIFQSVSDIQDQTKEYAATGGGIALAAQGIGARVANDLFTQYLRTGAKNFSELLFMAHDVFRSVSDITFPSTMCPRLYGEGLCEEFSQ